MNKSTASLFFIFLYFSISLAMAQSKDENTSKRINQLQEITYSINAQLFAEQRLFYKTKNAWSFPWKAVDNTKEELLSSLDSVAKNSSITLGKTSFSESIKLSTEFPSYIKNAKDKADLQLIISKVKNAQNQPIEIDPKGSTFFGFENSVSSNGSSSKVVNKTNLNASYNITTEKPGAGFKGSVVFKLRYITSYDYILIEKKDKGKIFSINGISYTVVDIRNNKLILLPSAVPSEKPKVINLDESDKEIGALSFSDFAELKAKDNTITTSMPPSTSIASVDEKIYTLFAENPALTLEEFKQKTNDLFAKLMEEGNKGAAGKLMGPKYMIVTLPSPIEKLYLYAPIYGVEKEFEIKLP